MFGVVIGPVVCSARLYVSLQIVFTHMHLIGICVYLHRNSIRCAFEQISFVKWLISGHIMVFITNS